MKNERAFLRKTGAPAACLLAAALLLLAGCRDAMHLAGCHDPVHPASAVEAAPATGSLCLTIGPGRARTIQPQVSRIEDFYAFALHLSHQDTGDSVDIHNWDGTPVAGLAVGDWQLAVTAFLLCPAGSPVAAAGTGGPVPFVVSAGQTTSLSVVELYPLSAGDGWFAWDLHFPGDSASVSIAHFASGDPVAHALAVLPGYPGSLELPAGRYRAHLSLSHEGRDITISRILNIYAGMTSPWVEAFTVDDFNRPFLDYFLESWNGSWWDLSWVQPGHFDILRVEEGIQGVYPWNYWTIRNQFNAIHRLPWHPGYNTADCLRVLVDAALIATGVQQGSIVPPCCCYETAINGTDITFVREWDWWDITFPGGWSIPWQWWDYETVAIIGNYYIVGIWQLPPVAPPCGCNPYLCCCDTPHFPSCHCGSYCWCSEYNGWCIWPGCSPCRCDNCWCDNHCLCGNGSPAIIFDGNGYWGSTLPGSVAAWPGDWILLPVWYADRPIDGYWFAFRGWSTNPDGTFPEFMPGEMFQVIDDVTLYAVWSEYGFVFDFADGTVTGFSGGSSIVVIPPTINGVWVSSIGYRAFAWNHLSYVVIPEGVTSIGMEAFADNWLSWVSIPWGVTHIGMGAFANNWLNGINIPSSVTHIGAGAFANNTLTSIYIPYGVNVGYYPCCCDGWDWSSYWRAHDTMGFFGNSFLAFYEAHGRRGGTYELINDRWFNNVTSSWCFYSGGRFLFDSSGTIVGFTTGWSSTIFIPYEIHGIPVTGIGAGAFAHNGLTNVVIPGSVTWIGHGAFADNRLTDVVIPSSVTLIEGGAFVGNSLTAITMPDSVSVDHFIRIVCCCYFGWEFPPWWSWSIFLPSMGIHGESFLDFYNSTGQRAGTYLWIEAENRWILYGDYGEVFVFDIRFTGFADGEAGIGFDQSVSVLDPVALITVAGAFDQIRWFYAGQPVAGAGIVQGDHGETFDFARLHGNRIGPHFVTVEVRRGGRWYNSQIRINVTM